MLKSLTILRNIHLNNTNWSSTKAQLMKLRKKTGYTFESCKKALELNNNNLEKSEEWLKEEARRLGWAKANKLANRVTSQGVIALAVDNQKQVATMVEVNCETDFVARNKSFQSVVDVVTSSCLDFAKKQKALENSFSKVNLKSGELMALSGTEGKSLADHIAVTIGNLGENLTLRRATCLNTQDTGLNIIGVTHPANSTGNHYLTGKYGSLIIYRRHLDDHNINEKSLDNSHNEILRQMCQHVIGMNPKIVGVLRTYESPKSQDEIINNDTLTVNEDTSVDERKNVEFEEDGMLEQAFLLDPSLTVGQVATEYGIDVLDFVRYECGES
ncbi:elongation factor Ts, mitochondrial [Daktulosphaira vitifoliae]|uniref:elongation factor Ts, mitochondrial n=1 Tax=Daktulosphaira vitifoliae TaxID=58002 RepID=UPI0021AA6666|nr:elongation factor Ts, mitochondrial [Daktulosphaira vitifoliae]